MLLVEASFTRWFWASQWGMVCRCCWSGFLQRQHHMVMVSVIFACFPSCHWGVDLELENEDMQKSSS